MMPEEIMKTLVVMSGLMMMGQVEARECGTETGTIPKTTKCYEVHTEQKSWTQALAHCRHSGGKDGDLATVRNNEQAGAFVAALGGSRGKEVWIGATCEDKCGKGKTDAWYWITDEVNVSGDVITWGPNQPDNDCTTSSDPCSDDTCNLSERVMVTKNLIADDRGYWEEHAFVCEYCAKTPTGSEPKLKPNCVPKKE